MNYADSVIDGFIMILVVWTQMIYYMIWPHKLKDSTEG